VVNDILQAKGLMLRTGSVGGDHGSRGVLHGGAESGIGGEAGDAAAVGAGQGIVVEGATFAASSSVGAVVGGAVTAPIVLSGLAGSAALGDEAAQLALKNIVVQAAGAMKSKPRSRRHHVMCRHPSRASIRPRASPA
jgi:hypothetical protein